MANRVNRAQLVRLRLGGIGGAVYRLAVGNRGRVSGGRVAD